MEQITRRDDGYYYGELRCLNVDDAYARFRDDYHKTLGRDASRRLDRAGQRKERIKSFGFCGGKHYEPGVYGKVRYRLLGLVGIHYCRIFGIYDLPVMDDDAFEDFVERILSAGNKAMVLVGKQYKAGRTAKRQRARYR